MEHKIAKSYGIIPVFRNGTEYNILIVQNSKGGHFGLPKGTPENDEVPMQTAIRELQEETGIEEKDIQIQESPTFFELYSFEQNNIIYDKTNTYYIGFVDNMTVGENLDQIIKAEWVSLQDAKNKLTHKEIVKVVNELEEYLKAEENH
jgi:8-oxo-dGTP pyrophosphatase MutT (NUDIX family)